MPTWVYWVAYAIVSVGAYVYAASQDYGNFDNMLKADDSTVPPADTGLGFAAFPQYPAGELPVPVVFGTARLNGLIAHTRPYGNNFSKCHYVLLWGDKGYTVNQLYVDKYKLEDLPNYYENIDGATQTSDYTWANTYPLGGEIQITLNNSGVFGVMRTSNTVVTLVASNPVIFYGGGTIVCRGLHTWPKIGTSQTWQWKLTNINDPSDFKLSPVKYYFWYEAFQIDGSGSPWVEIPGASLSSHTFTVADPLTKWSAALIVTQITAANEGAQIAFYDYTIVDTSYNELVVYNATVTHIHLVKDETLTSNNPVVNAEVSKTEQGNPATCLYQYLTDTAVGLGLPNVDWVSASETGAWCTTEALYYNRAITAFYGDDKLIKEMCTCGRIILYEESGKIKMRPDKAELVTYLVDDTEIIPGSLKIGVNSKTMPNRIEGQYTEPFYGYTVERIYAEDHADIKVTGARPITLGLAGVTNQSQAHDLVHLALNYTTKSLYWCSFNTGLETAAMFKVGDVIEITSETNVLIDGKKWRVQKITEKDLFSYNIYCKHYVDEIYDFPVFSPWYEQITDLEPLHGWPGPETGPATVINIIFEDITFPVGCQLVTSVVLLWTNPTERFTQAYLYYSHNNIDWIFIGSTSAGGYSFDWPMRYGMLYIKVVSEWDGVTNDSTAPIVAQYVVGDPLCIDTGYPGYGTGQYGMQYWGL